MLKINLRESAPVAFEMIIEGSSSTCSEAWFIIEADGFDVRIPAKHENDQIRCVIPALEGIILQGKAVAHLEIVVDGRFFRPVTEEVQLGTGRQEINVITARKPEPKLLAPQQPKPAEQPKAAPTFAESFAALDKIRAEAPALTNVWDEAGLGDHFEKVFAENQAAHAKKLKEAKEIAKSLVGGLNTNPSATEKAQLADLKRSIFGVKK